MEGAHLLVAEITKGAMADKSILTVSVAYGDLIAPLLNLTKKAGRAVVPPAIACPDLPRRTSSSTCPCSP